MKVLHVGQLIGGLDVYIRNSIQYLDEDFEFVIAHGKDDKSQPIIRNGIEVREYKTSLQRKLGFSDFRTIKEIIKIINEEKPDLIHCHSAKGGAIGRIAASRTKTPVVYTPHAFSYLSTPNKLKRFLFKSIERFTKYDTYLLACSHSEQKMGMENVGYDSRHALVWDNAVPDLKDNFEIPKDNISGDYICYIGRPSYQKNMSLFVDVVDKIRERHPDIKLLLLGVGFYSPDLKRLEKDLSFRNLNRFVIMKPWLSHEETLGYLKNSLFYLTTSRYEGLPLSVVEAMSLSKAVVASDVIGNKDCVIDGVNGFLGRNAYQIAEGCSKLIEDKQLREKLGRNGRIIFEKKFNIDSRISELSQIYRRVADKNLS